MSKVPRKSLPPIYFPIGGSKFSIGVITIRVRSNGALEYGFMARIPMSDRPKQKGAQTAPWRWLNGESARRADAAP